MSCKDKQLELDLSNYRENIPESWIPTTTIIHNEHGYYFELSLQHKRDQLTFGTVNLINSLLMQSIYNTNYISINSTKVINYRSQTLIE